MARKRAYILCPASEAIPSGLLIFVPSVFLSRVLFPFPSLVLPLCSTMRALPRLSHPLRRIALRFVISGPVDPPDLPSPFASCDHLFTLSRVSVFALAAPVANARENPHASAPQSPMVSDSIFSKPQPNLTT